VLPNEDPDEYKRLLEQQMSQYAPSTTHEDFLVREMVAAQWKLARLQRIENQMLESITSPTDAFTRLERYRASIERTYMRAERELRASLKRKNSRNKRSSA